MERVMRDMTRMMIATNTTTTTTIGNPCAVGTKITRTTFHPVLPKEINYLPDWKSNLCDAVRSRLGLQKRLQPCPENLERRLPPPPPECDHVLVGGHIVLLNRRTSVVVDIVHFEVR